MAACIAVSAVVRSVAAWVASASRKPLSSDCKVVKLELAAVVEDCSQSIVLPEIVVACPNCATEACKLETMDGTAGTAGVAPTAGMAGVPVEIAV